MRTTVNIDARLLIEVKTLAARTGRTIGEVIEDALRASLARRQASGEPERVRLPTHPGGGARPGVDLDDTAALLDLMDGAGR
ncbi:MAG: CopG family transcriptional regulator [Chloroflexota bacterium]